MNMERLKTSHFNIYNISITWYLLQVRQIVSDFAVLLAIILMVGMDIAIGIPTPKLEVPEKFSVSTCIYT